MAKTRRRRYKSRHEKWLQTKRNTRIIIIFAMIALVVLLFKNRYEIWDWVRSFFY